MKFTKAAFFILTNLCLIIPVFSQTPEAVQQEEAPIKFGGSNVVLEIIDIADVELFSGQTSMPITSQYVLEVDVQSETPWVASLRGLDKPILVDDQLSEPVTSIDFRNQSVLAGTTTLRWLFEQRIGLAPDIKRLILSSKSDVLDDVDIIDSRIVPIETLSDEAIFDATEFEPTRIRFKSYFAGQTELQRLSVMLPNEIVRRRLMQEIVIYENGQEAKREVLQLQPDSPREIWVREFSLPLFSITRGTNTVSARIESESGDVLLDLGTESFTFEEDNVRRNFFEVPYRGMATYSPFFYNNDLRVIGIPFNHHSKPEPKGEAISQHEMIDFTISQKTTRYREHVGWRIPPFGHWAQGGFHDLAIGRLNESFAIYTSGQDALGNDSIGFGAVTSGAPVGAPVNNPIYYPTEELTKWNSTKKLDLMSAGAVPYYRAFVMLTYVESGDEPSRIMASVSNDIRSWIDVGFVQQFDGMECEHLHVFKRGEIFYLVFNDKLYTSVDPLRTWAEVDLNVGAGLRELKFAANGEDWYVFGLEAIDARDVVKWFPIIWETNSLGIPVPVSVKE